jgi:hypothetical protein
MVDAKALSETLAKTAGILGEEGRPNSDQSLQSIVGDPDDVRTSIFFAYMMPWATFEAHDGSQWNILDYSSPDQINIENRWYPRINAIVSIGDIRRSIHMWLEPVQQTVPPPPPGVDYSALPVKVMDKESNKGGIDTLTDNVHSDQTGGW